MPQPKQSSRDGLKSNINLIGSRLPCVDASSRSGLGERAPGRLLARANTSTRAPRDTCDPSRCNQELFSNSRARKMVAWRAKRTSAPQNHELACGRASSASISPRRGMFAAQQSSAAGLFICLTDLISCRARYPSSFQGNRSASQLVVAMTVNTGLVSNFSPSSRRSLDHRKSDRISKRGESS